MNVHDADSLNCCVTRFTETVNKLANPFFSKKIPTECKHSHQVFKRADWFDDECKVAKRNYLLSLYDYNNQKNVQTRETMCDKKSIYKNIIRKKKNTFTRTRLKEIANIRHKSPKQFWTLFSKISTKQSNNISTNDFYEYFANTNKYENISENFTDENILINSDNCILMHLTNSLHSMKLNLLHSHSREINPLGLTYY